ncbi:MAG: acyl-ACP--UDP-N-acetylglucosamine O-acyltransferase [Pontibacterium sp.]
MIHPQAIVDPTANIADDVKIGPWTYIGPNVTIDEGTVIESHVVIKGPTRIGKGNRIFQFSSIGEECQDLKYNGEPTELVIGDYNTIREGVTIHRGTIQDNSLTSIGSHNLLMAYVHVAHDCVVGNHVILANNTSLAGHVRVADWAILGGFTAIHQFCQVGEHVMTGVNSVIFKDVPAYVKGGGNPFKPRTINAEGLKRRGFSAETIAVLKRAYRLLYRENLTVEQSIEALEALQEDTPAVALLIDSVKASTRGISR